MHAGGNGSPIRCGQAEKNFAKLTEQHPELVAAARRRSSVVDPKSGVGGTRRMGVWQEWQVQRLGRRVQ